MPIETAAGRDRAWNLLKKLGEGDAGEIFLVESLLDKQTAILKRPRRSAFASDAVRQASQIEREGRILSALAGLTQPATGAPAIGRGRPMQVPRLLDQSKPGTEFSERFFIVISRAQGFDLNFLARAVRFGELAAPALLSDLPLPLSPSEQVYIKHLSRQRKIPDLLLLRALLSLVELLETIHAFEVNLPGSSHHGIIWNDVKPDHVFWDPLTARFTVIDWGNAHFLEADGATTDRQFSRTTDYRQFLDEMGRFLSNESPDLLHELAWPSETVPSTTYTASILPLKERLIGLLIEEQAKLRQARQGESNLTQAGSPPSFERLQQLIQHLENIHNLGEIPDYQNAEKIFLQVARQLVNHSKLAEFQQLCKSSGFIPTLSPTHWSLLSQFAQHAARELAFQQALSSALDEDWPGVHWHLRQAASSDPPPPWWETYSAQVRLLQLGVGPEVLTPYTALNRLIHTLQAAALQPAAPLYARSVSGPSDSAPIPARHLLHDRLARTLKQEVLLHWKQPDPDPPDSGIEYREIERYLPDILEFMPAAGQALVNALDQPRAQIKIALDAWERKDFDTARMALRRVLLWDPDWRRLLLADQAIQSAPLWLQDVQKGPRKDEPLQDFTTRLELRGRDLRNQVGSASWLEEILEMMLKLRKGTEPTEVLMQHASLRSEFSWLLEAEPNRPILGLPDQPLILERENGQGFSPALQPDYIFRGVQETALGEGQALLLTDPLDTWVPEARGSSARVFLGLLQSQNWKTHQVAVKIMRPDRADYALPLFREEVQVLALLHDVPGITPLLELGFIQLENDSEIPPEDRQISAASLKGRAIRYGADSIHNFLMELPGKASQGWLPYIAIQKRERADNLLLQCDVGYTRGRFLPLLSGLRMGIQICEIIEAAHARNIAYRDHKILHYYWLEKRNGIFSIDWNIARRYPEGLPRTDAQFDLVQFGARTLHHILTGRSAPGALPLGPTRPDEIEAAARSYTARWTYDDQRLPKDVKETLERLLAGEYSQARLLREDLLRSFHTLSELIPKA